MALTPVAITDFSGLDLTRDPEEVGINGAIDLLNIAFDQPGKLRAREGYTQTHSGNSSSDYFLGKLFFGCNSYYITSHYDGTYDLVTLADGGSIIATQNNVGTLYSAVDASTATSKLTYLVAVTAGDSASCYSTTGTMVSNAFTAQANVPVTAWSHLAVQPEDNRLVVINAAAGLGSSFNNKVAFSKPNEHTTFQALDYIALDPGSKDKLNGVCAWNDLLFVFGPKKFWVFYGNTANNNADTGDGGAVTFNVREIDTGVGLRDQTRSSTHKPLPPLAVTPEGVYFLSHDGLYLTTGGPPIRVPSPMDTFFLGGALNGVYLSGAKLMPWFTPIVDGDVSTAVSDQFLHLAYTDGQLIAAIQNKLFVLDVRTQRWSYWSLPVNRAGLDSLAVIRDPTFALVDRVWFVARYNASATPAAGGVFYFNPTASADHNTAISSFYRSGFGDFGYAAAEKTIRETELVGSGTVSFAWSRDFGAVPTGSNVTMGSVSAGGRMVPARGLHRDAQYGELLSWKVAGVTSSNNGVWELQRLVPALREVRGVFQR